MSQFDRTPGNTRHDVLRSFIDSPRQRVHRILEVTRSWWAQQDRDGGVSPSASFTDAASGPVQGSSAPRSGGRELGPGGRVLLRGRHGAHRMPPPAAAVRMHVGLAAARPATA